MGSEKGFRFEETWSAEARESYENVMRATEEGRNRTNPLEYLNQVAEADRILSVVADQLQKAHEIKDRVQGVSERVDYFAPVTLTDEDTVPISGTAEVADDSLPYQEETLGVVGNTVYDADHNLTTRAIGIFARAGFSEQLLLELAQAVAAGVDRTQNKV